MTLRGSTKTLTSSFLKKETSLSSSCALASCLGVVSRTKEAPRSVEEKSGVRKKEKKKESDVPQSAFSETPLTPDAYF